MTINSNMHKKIKKLQLTDTLKILILSMRQENGMLNVNSVWERHRFNMKHSKK